MELLTGIIGLILLIVWLVMADNIGTIKKTLQAIRVDNSMNYSKVYRRGELKEYQGKDQEALDCYLEAFYFASKTYVQGKKERRMKEEDLAKIRGKIIALGGNIKEVV